MIDGGTTSTTTTTTHTNTTTMATTTTTTPPLSSPIAVADSYDKDTRKADGDSYKNMEGVAATAMIHDQHDQSHRIQHHHHHQQQHQLQQQQQPQPQHSNNSITGDLTTHATSNHTTPDSPSITHHVIPSSIPTAASHQGTHHHRHHRHHHHHRDRDRDGVEGISDSDHRSMSMRQQQLERMVNNLMSRLEEVDISPKAQY